MSALTAKLLDGRTGAKTQLGFSSLVRRYLIMRQNRPLSATAAQDEADIFAAEGLPAIGSAHPASSDLVCTELAFAEKESIEKNQVIVTATYSASDSSSSSPSGAVPRTQSVEQLSWRPGSETRDAVCDVVTGAVIASSAGEPFESVPQINVPLSVWTKVLRTKNRHLEWRAYEQKINAAATQCGGISCPAKTLKCEGVAEDRIWNDPDGWKYRYTITIAKTTNRTKVGDDPQVVDIGWDVAVVDTGMYELDENGKLQLIKIRDPETRTDRPVTAAVLLNGSGKHLASYAIATDPFILRFQVYESTNFPAIFCNDSGETGATP